ncbi:hypothetical protein MUO66_06195, partial [Candidatus Bathyarchaeota archaeon]|nr:hypothetical protein [Candidatus Bathyarchaeota archaeon]
MLELPEDEDINLHIGDESEHLLHERAEKIKEQFRSVAGEIMFSNTLTFEEQTVKAQELLKELTEDEKFIPDESAKFIRFRLTRLLFKVFSSMFPKIHYKEVTERIVWFFEDMQKLVNAKAIEDSEWNFNRDEDDPDFDDFKWWDSVEAKIREVYPKGIFTKESYEAVRDYFDEKESEFIRKYWKTHPEEFKEYMEQIDKKLESLKSE